MADFYSQVPKDLRGNLDYRLKVLRRAGNDLGYRAACMTAAREDILWFLNVVAFVHEPRPQLAASFWGNEYKGGQAPKRLPLITWPHQDEAIRDIQRTINGNPQRDLGVEKSRGEGATWIASLFALHDWIFNKDCIVGMCSKDENTADIYLDTGSLMGKLDWEMKQLPTWMVGREGVDWERNQGKSTLFNKRHNNLVIAFAATSTIAVGRRFSWFLFDEMAKWDEAKARLALESLQQTTSCRLFVSTPQGARGPYYDVMHAESNMVPVVLDWKDNITRNRGLYQLEHGLPIAVDPVNNPLPSHYNPPTNDVLSLFERLRKKGFTMEGRLRSPWYDNECDRPDSSPVSIAQELDRDYGGSSFKSFPEEFFTACQPYISPPLLTGTMLYDGNTLEPKFERRADGQVHLWVPLDRDDNPPPGQYVVACDIARGLPGTHSSNSVIEVVQAGTGEQVLEFATNTMVPSELAAVAIAISKWFYDALLAWEVDGPGKEFGEEVKSRGYWNLYHRTPTGRRGNKKTKELGWLTGRGGNKGLLIQEIRHKVLCRKVCIRSKPLLAECHEFQVDAQGKDFHAASRSKENNAAQGEAHGDRVIAFGVALMALRDLPEALDIQQLMAQLQKGDNVHSFYDEEEEQDEDSWDHRSLQDLADGTSAHGLPRGIGRTGW